MHVTSKTTTKKVRQQLNDFVAAIPGAFNYYDVGLNNQLGIIQQADVFLSPHTGFAFLAPCLGTPWLALSGGQWAEHMPAQMPFYSTLPNCNRYPCNNGDMLITCQLRLKLKQPIKCMGISNSKINEVLEGLKKLLNSEYNFNQAFEDYEDLARIKGVNLKKLWRINEYKNFAK